LGDLTSVPFCLSADDAARAGPASRAEGLATVVRARRLR